MALATRQPEFGPAGRKGVTAVALRHRLDRDAHVNHPAIAPEEVVEVRFVARGRDAADAEAGAAVEGHARHERAPREPQGRVGAETRQFRTHFGALENL